MLIAGIIKAILSNFVLIFLAIAILTSIVKARRAQRDGAPANVTYVVWGEMLFYMYGLANIYGGIVHAYFGLMAASSIGWQTSPFQYELGWFEIGYGVVAIMSLWRGYEFRLAATIPYSIFALAAAAQHISMMINEHNYAQNNAGAILWIGDVLVPLGILTLAYLSRPSGRRLTNG